MFTKNTKLDEYDFDLPGELIAQFPADRRDESKLFVLHKINSGNEHTLFKNIGDYLRPGDLLVFNDAKVINARIYCTRESGGKVEIILTEKLNDTEWKALSNKKRKLKLNEELRSISDPSILLLIAEKHEDSLVIHSNVPLTEDMLRRIGSIPLPPYIKRDAVESDDIRYQTVYASQSGAVASPTAGLHFTHELLNDLGKRGIISAHVTLFVSWGTFQPIRPENLERNRIHSENFILTEDNANKINKCRDEGGRIISVGTTALRVLESTLRDGINVPMNHKTDLFIYPPYEIRSVHGLITNFHTPRSSLLMLVSAFAEYETIMKAYKTAIAMKYRFFSYGDAMFITD